MKIKTHLVNFSKIMNAIIIATIIGLLILLTTGVNPIDALSAAYWGTFSAPFRFGNTTSRFFTISLMSLAAAIPFSSGMMNIGGDGQLTIGAFFAALIGFGITGLPQFIHLPLAIVSGMVMGALWAAIPAFLRLKFNSNEMVVTMMMNYIASQLTEYLVIYPFKAPNSSIPETINILDSAKLDKIIPLSNLNFGFVVTIIAIILIAIIVYKTTIGYEWRVLGSNRAFAQQGGVSAPKMQFLSMVVGGAFAGLAGSILTLGVHNRFITGISSSFGFTGVLIALISSNSVYFTLIIAAIFAILQSSIVGMEGKLGVAVELSDVVQSLMILFLLIRDKIWKFFGRVFDRDIKKGNSNV